jgi:hypothetical protein
VLVEEGEPRTHTRVSRTDDRGLRLDGAVVDKAAGHRHRVGEEAAGLAEAAAIELMEVVDDDRHRVRVHMGVVEAAEDGRTLGPIDGREEIGRETERVACGVQRGPQQVAQVLGRAGRDDRFLVQHEVGRIMEFTFDLAVTSDEGAVQRAVPRDQQSVGALEGLDVDRAVDVESCCQPGASIVGTAEVEALVERGRYRRGDRRGRGGVDRPLQQFAGVG